MAARGSLSYQITVNVDDERFMNPESMIAEVVDAASKAGNPPRTVGDIVQCVYRSLAEAYADTIANLTAITGRNFSTIHIVGGGCQDRYLNTLTAEATGLNVVVGPVEATATGNLIVQMMAAGEFESLEEARKAILA